MVRIARIRQARTRCARQDVSDSRRAPALHLSFGIGCPDRPRHLLMRGGDAWDRVYGYFTNRFRLGSQTPTPASEKTPNDTPGKSARALVSSPSGGE